MSYHFSPDPRLEFSPVCRGLILINVAVFGLMTAGAKLGVDALDAERMLDVFGLYPDRLFREGLLWTPFTYMFLHAGILHVGMNMMGLYLLGPDLEQVFGHVRFLATYLISGLVGALAFLGISHLLPGPSLPVVGASGAIFGLLGGIVALYPFRVYVILPLMIPMKAYVLAVLILTSHLFFILTPYGSNVAYDVHLGGGLAGFFMAGGAAAIHRRRYRKEMPVWDVPVARVELESLAHQLATDPQPGERVEDRYRELRHLLRYEDIPSVEELRATRR